MSSRCRFDLHTVNMREVIVGWNDDADSVSLSITPLFVDTKVKNCSRLGTAKNQKKNILSST